jgi:predicted ATPase
MAANEPDVLAHHYTEAELHDQATTYWIAAARRAVERFANAEAIGYVDRGLRTLKALPAGTERDQKELLLQVNLGTALGSSKGFTPPEVGQAFARARDLCERVGQTPQMLVILDGLWVYYVMRADYDTSGQIDDQILDLARRTNDSAGLVAGHQSSCGTALFRGEFERAVEQGDKGWAAYNEEEHKSIGAVYSRNPAIVNLDFSAWALLSMGFLDRAVERHAEAVRLAMKEGYPLTIATVTAHAAVIHYLRDDAQSTLDVAQQVIARCKESGILIRQTEGEMLEGWALAVMGNTERGIPQLEAALNMWNMIGAQIANPIWYSCLSRAYQKAGRMDEARSALQKGIEHVEKNHEGLVEAEVHRLDGELRLAIRQDDPAAESCLRKAIQISKAQKAKLFELRASVSLAKLWQSQNKRREAHDLLAPTYNWFTEGFDTRDLKEAKALLDELV